MSDTTPGVIYLEVDEDITSAIDKLTKSPSATVQVVAAKRSTLFQSLINLKLLQKAAKDARKKLVLVTGDRVATNLAGKLGVAVAQQVGEAAHVPVAVPLATKAAEDEIDGGAIGDIAASAAAGGDKALPTSPLESPKPATPAPPANSSNSKPVVPKRQRVPNIGKMQKWVLWLGALVILVALWFVGNYLLTSAQVTLYAQASQVHASFDFTADPTAAESSVSDATLSAQQLSENKTLNTTVQATGTQDEGSKATGTMTIYNSCGVSSQSLVAGTRFVSGDGHIFLSTADVSVPGGGTLVPGQAQVSVQASQNGDDYNLGPTQYTIPGLSSSQQSCMYGQGSQMQGGVTKTVKVIQQSDVATAQQAALAANKGTATADLSSDANNQQVALPASFQQSVTSATPNPTVGAVADSATLSIQVTYTMLAVQKSELSQLAQAQESQQLGPQSQIYDDGSGNLQLTALGQPQSSGAQKFKANATAYAGTKIDTNALAKQLKGQKYGDAVNTASSVPGVTKATVTLSPSWASGLPHISGHIHVQIKVSNPSG